MATLTNEDEPDYVELETPRERRAVLEDRSSGKICKWLKKQPWLAQLVPGGAPKSDSEDADSDEDASNIFRTQWDRTMLNAFAVSYISNPNLFVELIRDIYSRMATMLPQLVLSPGGCEFTIEFRNGYLLQHLWQHVESQLNSVAPKQQQTEAPRNVGGAAAAAAAGFEGPEEKVWTQLAGGVKYVRVSRVLEAVNRHFLGMYPALKSHDQLLSIWSTESILDGDVQATLQLLLAVVSIQNNPIHISEKELGLQVLVSDRYQAAPVFRVPNSQWHWKPLISDAWLEVFGSFVQEAPNAVPCPGPGHEGLPNIGNNPEPDDDYEAMTSTGVLVPAVSEEEVLEFANHQLDKIGLQIDELSQLYDGTILLFVLSLRGDFFISLSEHVPGLTFHTVEGEDTRVEHSSLHPLQPHHCLQNMTCALDNLRHDGAPVDDIAAGDLVRVESRRRSLLDLFGRILLHYGKQ